ncbi:elongation factor Ts [bacterium (Candidatus Moisslbacteria) CG02_land_8_20_14_3_00_36_53]|uniref:Elongation factor Ts n=1 Tax=Candidatus Berkelbacteria bacterium CG23_combo_of_CG06-09_8_20_14_all_41_73 TaxID=1974519 RepID=A0A2H0B1Q6_9BACT|nr:elongation factor Ts [Candidatus Kuenenbacteria bacterium]OIP76528.1 MAG: hypothetical protein AUK09_01720 [Parcubacteria group bacterium CG2_30_36_38]PIP50980.1 MAG: elongation factor Ts [Candidatus Berkelbacteria bacterium CG23_combo_of_CG06-09_8_20_14_all_41_73]PIV46048.1 MAG: elongation factor Ts [bacterium (Candidatus Moisslbacteria) CG02_land_8_20_14_3_00_36_53]PJC00760.1 MAG: elongation factor Ts [bacterium (Candidatus Moisslbacteria) CG_4_9_14_0_8_um_filter_36_20]
MEISIDLIKKLREKTGISIAECKKALIEKGGDEGKALEFLRKKGEEVMAAKAERTTKSGIIGFYLHADLKQAALVKLLCETDFVARNEEFKTLAHDLAMQIVALNPQWVSPSDVPESIIKKEKEIYLRELDKKKPKTIKEKIIDGKLAKFYRVNCLLKQSFIKQEDLTIEQLMADYVNKLGEKIEVKEFVRLKI